MIIDGITLPSGTVLDVNELESVDNTIAPTDWVAPTLTNSWQNYGAPYATAAYRKDSEGFVHLKGMIQFGSIGQAAFTLPAGYLPGEVLIFGTICNGGVARIDLDVGGAVIVNSPSTNAWVSISGVSFKAA